MENRALSVLEKYYGYKTFRRGQEDIINKITNGKDVLAIMPTGGGKSICYQILIWWTLFFKSYIHKIIPTNLELYTYLRSIMWKFY